MKKNNVVKINADIKAGQNYDGCFVSDEMELFAGMLAEIIDIDVDGIVMLDVTGSKFVWNKKMFSPIGILNTDIKTILAGLVEIISDLGSIDVTGQPGIDSYIDSARNTARKLLSNLGEGGKR